MAVSGSSSKSKSKKLFSEKKGQSIGIVRSMNYKIPGPFSLESGKTLSGVRIEYEMYGKQNADKSNVILICHALTGDAHAAGFHTGDRKPGWWDIVIGPNKAFDTEKYCVICSNILGGCKGSTGPSSIDPETGKHYGISFPVITIADMVKAQKKLVEHLGVKQLFAVVGGSMGGMQVLQWTVSYPEMVKKAIAIATTASTTPQQIAFGAIGRKAVTDDPKWNGGNYYGKEIPAQGLALARMIGHITYLSDASMQKKFGRLQQDADAAGITGTVGTTNTNLSELSPDASPNASHDASHDLAPNFQVESYLNYQGDNFTKRFDANSYLYITKAVDYFDLSRNGSLIEGFSGVTAKYLVISISSDWLYPPYQAQDIVSALTANGVDARYEEIRSQYGHDAFLLEEGQLNYLIRSFLSQILVSDVMNRNFYSVSRDETIEHASRLMVKERVSHLPVISEDGKLEGIVTSWDITKAVACKINELDEIITRDVRYVYEDERIEKASSIMEDYSISALPVIDSEHRVIGLVTSESISALIGRFG
ncbi:homoserine acetyltransferase [Methanosarcina sp. 2.H.T.1A.6]|uniref:homoserine O-acetyltransferase MetX n=1 Tax=unclassified Methanosarcina TaxID=2644672 RepID=UPI000621A696|nr:MULTISPECIES: homoserine O-acetyltransferase [unclassified Methanosarcina]KKG18176.1 homoserine acetyltransferase [Methanosarcina sp. 2.H.T.1A.3]KKG19083.1 homoserine acetyltransferase [Methanosarcina sp. 2.H.T.1A.15]KKG19399.1 homoserine acetyltransferase [Methanosarcina sp. 2.H.T.1A.6]KKG25560.1 homoserine acetyltransferase [Methanosarcina sp. 2.H.T.1A.8]